MDQDIYSRSSQAVFSTHLHSRKVRQIGILDLVGCAPATFEACRVGTQKLVFHNLDLNKSTTVYKVGDLEVFPKAFWIWKHIHVHKVHVREVHAYELHA